jgi:branched-chain amino acid transport system substrate-binding protein
MMIRWNPARARRATIAVAAALVPLAPRAAPAVEPFVLGQSLPVPGAMAQFSRQVIGGTQACVEHVNANGGIQGRPVRLVTLDDGGDPARHEANLRTLPQESRAIALLNCADDASCLRAAKVAARSRAGDPT